jgi:RNA polymerase-binding transcription factor DksA
VAERKRGVDDALSRRAEDVERLREFVENTSFSGDETQVSGELSKLDQHPADTSDVTEQRARDDAIRQLLERESEQIEAARRRQAEGSYGICAGCGKAIPAERLEARPEATLCVDCQRASEGR